MDIDLLSAFPFQVSSGSAVHSASASPAQQLLQPSPSSCSSSSSCLLSILSMSSTSSTPTIPTPSQSPMAYFADEDEDMMDVGDVEQLKTGDGSQVNGLFLYYLNEQCMRFERNLASCDKMTDHSPYHPNPNSNSNSNFTNNIHDSVMKMMLMDDHHSQQQQPQIYRICSHCGCQDTPMWRKAGQDQVCNACGLYYKQHGRIRKAGKRGGGGRARNQCNSAALFQSLTSVSPSPSSLEEGMEQPISPSSCLIPRKLKAKRTQVSYFEKAQGISEAFEQDCSSYSYPMSSSSIAPQSSSSSSCYSNYSSGSSNCSNSSSSSLLLDGLLFSRF